LLPLRCRIVTETARERVEKPLGRVLFGREYQHSGQKGKRAGKTSSARAKSERFSTGESGAQVAEKPARQAKRLVAVPFSFLLS
jgi:hypothetical protein